MLFFGLDDQALLNFCNYFVIYYVTRIKFLDLGLVYYMWRPSTEKATMMTGKESGGKGVVSQWEMPQKQLSFQNNPI